MKEREEKRQRAPLPCHAMHIGTRVLRESSPPGAVDPFSTRGLPRGRPRQWPELASCKPSVGASSARRPPVTRDRRRRRTRARAPPHRRVVRLRRSSCSPADDTTSVRVHRHHQITAAAGGRPAARIFCSQWSPLLSPYPSTTARVGVRTAHAAPSLPPRGTRPSAALPP